MTTPDEAAACGEKHYYSTTRIPCKEQFQCGYHATVFPQTIADASIARQ